MGAKVFRGDIFLADTDHYEFLKGIRPVIIVSNKKNNIHSPIINAIPIVPCKNIKEYPPYNDKVRVKIDKQIGLKEDSFALCDMIITLNKTDLTIKLGYLTPHLMHEIEKGLIYQWDMQIIK